jgi:hypothetical protein
MSGIGSKGGKDPKTASYMSKEHWKNLHRIRQGGEDDYTMHIYSHFGIYDVPNSLTSGSGKINLPHYPDKHDYTY